MKEKNLTITLRAKAKNVIEEAYVSQKEMEEIRHLYPNLKKGLKDAKEGRYKIIDDKNKSNIII